MPITATSDSILESAADFEREHAVPQASRTKVCVRLRWCKTFHALFQRPLPARRHPFLFEQTRPVAVQRKTSRWPGGRIIAAQQLALRIAHRSNWPNFLQKLPRRLRRVGE